MKNRKKILAILAVVLILIMFCMPMIFAFGKGEKAAEYFRISLAAAIIGPVLIYICMMIFRSRRKSSGPEISGIRSIVFHEGNVPGDPAWESWTGYLKDRGYLVHVLPAGKAAASSLETFPGEYGFMPEECVFIDDSPEYCKAAEAAGMKTVRFESFRQAVQDLEKLGVH